MQITTPAQLRALYAAPTERAQRKQLTALDRHCRAFIALSPFVVLATSDASGRVDATPRGGARFASALPFLNKVAYHHRANSSITSRSRSSRCSRSQELITDW